jgi:hypothetical protein
MIAGGALSGAPPVCLARDGRAGNRLVEVPFQPSLQVIHLKSDG